VGVYATPPQVPRARKRLSDRPYTLYRIWNAEKRDLKPLWLLPNCIHTVTPDEWEHVSVLSCINANGGSIPNFHKFKDKQFRTNCIDKSEDGACEDAACMDTCYE